jgi:multidrug transporter EmrE-like cation transporter
MSKQVFWTICAVAFAVIGNSISAVWARRQDTFSPWFFAMVAVAPLVFVSFGLVTSRLGLAVGSGVIDSLLTLATILVGLLAFGEWSRVSPLQYAGMALALAGVSLMVFFPKGG